jgi:rubrerythrin
MRALAKGAQRAGPGIDSGEGRMLPEGRPAVSPPSFTGLTTPDDFRCFADRVRELTGGIPSGMKMSARACGHTHLRQFNVNDITTWKREMADLTGIRYAGVGWSQAVPTRPAPTIPQPQQEEKLPMSTADNLQAAFAGESQANRKYLAFAAKADADGHPQIAKLFRAAAAAETVHAHAHLRVMGGVGDTKKNLQAAIEGEGHEFKEMYPAFIKEAEAEGNKAALISFRNANAVEKTHYDLYSKALEALEAAQDLTPASIYVCDVCGHTHVGGAPDRCPVCGAPKTKFKVVA